MIPVFGSNDFMGNVEEGAPPGQKIIVQVSFLSFSNRCRENVKELISIDSMTQLGTSSIGMFMYQIVSDDLAYET